MPNSLIAATCEQFFFKIPRPSMPESLIVVFLTKEAAPSQKVERLSACFGMRSQQLLRMAKSFTT